MKDQKNLNETWTEMEMVHMKEEEIISDQNVMEMGMEVPLASIHF